MKVFKGKTLEFTESPQSFTNNKNKLNVMLENQQNFHSKNGLRFNKIILGIK